MFFCLRKRGAFFGRKNPVIMANQPNPLLTYPPFRNKVFFLRGTIKGNQWFWIKTCFFHPRKNERIRNDPWILGSFGLKRKWIIWTQTSNLWWYSLVFRGVSYQTKNKRCFCWPAENWKFGQFESLNYAPQIQFIWRFLLQFTFFLFKPPLLKHMLVKIGFPGRI